jgi:hypothetical protein
MDDSGILFRTASDPDWGPRSGSSQTATAEDDKEESVDGSGTQRTAFNCLTLSLSSFMPPPSPNAASAKPFFVSCRRSILQVEISSVV